MCKKSRPGLAEWRIVAFLVAWSVLFVSQTNADDRGLNKKVPSDTQVTKLIEQLGSDSFATREKAQGELQRIGLFAFDALQEAQHNNDVEIRLAAKYLLRHMPISWTQEGDPREIRNYLKNYGEQTEDNRKSLMNQIAGLAGTPATVALCRLARFETSNLLAKRAALLMMNSPPPEQVDTRNNLVATIRNVVGQSKRSSSQWLVAFAKTLEDPETSLGDWQKLTAAELDVIRNTPDQTNQEIVRDLLRWHADLLRRQKHEPAAIAVVKRSLGLISADKGELVENVDWLLERSYWAQVNELANRFSDEFETSDQLLYRLAESERAQGKAKEADAAADKAFRVKLDSPERHVLAGADLEERGMFDWAEREFRHAMKVAPIESSNHVDARIQLAEMLHDRGLDFDAATVLQEYVDAMTKDPNLEQRLEQIRRSSEFFHARMNYFFALYHLEKNNLKAHQLHLEKAVAADPHEADVLIAMYRVPQANEAWKAKTKKMIWETARLFHDSLDQVERNQPDRAQAIANLCNQYAWLVGNTEGDYEEARRCSHRSLELLPANAGYMDTLARCYYAKKDYDNAVKYQSMAAKKKPHSGQILRQLALFEKSKAEEKKAE